MTATSAWPLDAVPKIDPTASAADTCDAVFGHDAGTQPRSMGAVAPEQSIAEDVTWKANWKPGSTVEVVGCGAVDGKFLNELSTIQPAKPNGGLFVHTFAVPKDVANGATVCERGVVLGESATGAAQAERTDADCYTVAGAAGAGSVAAAGPTPVSAASATPAKPDAAPAVSQPAAGAGSGGPAPAKTPIVAGTAGTRSAADASAPASESVAAPASGLARTAADDRMLLAMAGLLLLLGGSMVAFSRPLRLAAQRR